MRLIAASLLATVALANDFEKENGVFVLGNDDFDAAVAAHEYVLAEFYAPWCGHCKSLAPEYEKAAAALAGNENIALAKIDATIHGDLAQKYGVEGYPTLKWFVGDSENAMEYGGGRTGDDIVAWIKKKTGPAASALADGEALTKFKEDNPICVVGFFAEASSDEFLAVAKVHDASFGIVTDADAIKAAGYADGDVVLFKDFDTMEDKYSEGDLAEFIDGNSIPLVSEFSEETAPKIFGGSIKKHILLFTAKSSDSHAEVHAAFSATAAQFKGKVLFVHLDCDVEDNAQVMEFFGLEKEQCPTSRMINMEEGMHKFQSPSAELTTEAFTTFVSGVLDGSIERHLMSEDVPEDNSAPVTLLVGKNYQEVVAKNEGAVFVEFYAPWCGHCQQLAPIWEQLGEHFKDNAEVTIAKSDSTVNEFDDVEVEGFPTLKFWPKGAGSEMMDYNGGRTLEAMIKFVESNGEDVEEDEGGDEDDEEYDDEDYEDDDEEYDDEDDEEYDDEDEDDVESPEDHDEL